MGPEFKILMVSHGFPPVYHSGTFRMEAFARHLPENGIMPIVLAASDGGRARPYGSTSAAGPVEDRFVYRTDWGINRSSETAGGMWRLLRRLPWGWSIARERMRDAVLGRVLPVGRKAIREHQPCAILASAPPAETALAGYALAEEFGLPLIVDLRDPWSYFSWETYRHWVDFRHELGLERKVLDRAVSVIANTPAASDLLERRVLVPRSKIKVIMNGYDESLFQKAGTFEESESDRFIVAYTGILTTHAGSNRAGIDGLKEILGLDYSPVHSDPNTRSPRYFLEAVKSLIRSDPSLEGMLKLVFVGVLSEDDRACLDAFPYPGCVEIRGTVSHEDAVSIICRANLLLLLQIEMHIRGVKGCPAIPGKMYDYLRSGTRILAPVQNGDAQVLIEKMNAGIVVAPRDTAAIATALKAEITSWLQNGRKTKRRIPDGIAEFERRTLAARLAETIRSVC